MKPTKDLSVFISTSDRDSSCCECGEALDRGDWITLVEGTGALCLACADLDHLVFLPSGNAALTRRARKHSSLVAVVLKWSRARKRYERQGLLVREEALTQAETECLADSEVRGRRREREAARRIVLDQRYVERFALSVRELFASCPAEREKAIAEHACLRYSERIGRTAAGKQLDEQAVRLAVIAHIRHTESRYDELLAEGYERSEAREYVEETVREVLARWEAAPDSKV